MIVYGQITKTYLEALDFFASRLITPQKKKHIEIIIKYRRSIKELGTVYIDDYNVLGMPNSFVIELKNSLNEETKLKTLAHEMVHIKQYIRGELNEQMSIWKGQTVDSEKISYADQPWEIEAESTAIKLYNEYITNKTR